MRLALFLSCVSIAALALPGQAPTPTVLVRASLDTADASWRGAVAIADGDAGGAARFDGNQSRIDLGACPVSSRGSFTLRCRLRTNTSGFCTPLMARDGERVGLSLVLGRSPGLVSFEAWSWQSVRIPSHVRVDDGKWHAIEVAYDAASNVALLLVDGALQGTAELGEGDARTAQLRLGDNIGAHQPFAGDLDEVEVVEGTQRAAQLALHAQVLPRSAREAALQKLRERLLPKATPSLDATAADAWPQRKAAVKDHVLDALGLTPSPAGAPLDVRIHGELVGSGARVQRISWIGFAGHRATGWLWTPENPAPGRRPAILCPHGHWENGARHPVVQARCAAFAQFGWTALAVDSVHVEHVASGVNSVGAMTWHNQRAIDLLLARDDVDPTRLATTGASGGAQQSYYLMAIEDRLAAAAPMVMACYLAEIVADTSAHCGCNHTPRLAARTDVPEMCAVFAPRPAMFGSVAGDWTHAFPQQGLPELTAHWQRLGGAAPRSRFANEGHNYDQPMREEVYAFLFDVLTGPAPDGAPRTRVAEPGFRAFSLREFEPLVAACPNVQLDANAMAAEYLGRRPKVSGLADLAPGLDLDVAARPVQWLDPADARWRRGTVTGSDGVPIPLRLGRADDPVDLPYTVVIEPRGASVAMRYLERLQ
ncbi:MAG: LamG-like jellyroll fold domain-containing protein, partial [Planctomycetota bacterium]